MNTPFTIHLAGPITDAPRTIHGTPSQLANAGETLAADHAARLTDTDWKDLAYNFLLGYASKRDTFQCSDVRHAAIGFIPDHPELDKRAWGCVIQHAQRNGVIRALGYAPTERKESHGRQEQRWQFINL